MLWFAFAVLTEYLAKHAIDGTEISQNVVHYHGGSFTKHKINLV